MKISSWARFGAPILVAYASATAAQPAIEVFAGGEFYVDAPAKTVSTWPQALSIDLSGRQLYVVDMSGRVLRYDTQSGTVTRLPALPGRPHVDLGPLTGVAVDPLGTPYVTTDVNLHRVDLTTGDTPLVSRIDNGGAMLFAPDGTLYFASPLQHRVRKRLPTGEILAVAGDGTAGFSGDGGPATLARLSRPASLAIDSAGNLYIGDAANGRVRRISAQTGAIITVAGNGSCCTSPATTAPALNIGLGLIGALALDSSNSLYIASSGYLRRVDAATGLATTIGGNGIASMDGIGGPARNASTGFPNAMAFDAAGNLYLSDGNFGRVRRIDTAGIIDIAIGSGQLECGDGLPARGACLSVQGLDFDSAGNLVLIEHRANRLRRVSRATGRVEVVAGSFALDARGATHDASGALYFAGDNRVYTLPPGAAELVRYAGAANGSGGFGGDAGPAELALFAAPSDVAIDATGHLFITDTQNRRIRKIDAFTRVVSTYAGTGSSSAFGDGGPATVADIGTPEQIELDPAGNLVFSDAENCRLRRIDRASGIISTIVGNGICTISNPGNGGFAVNASIDRQTTFTFDRAGNIFLAFRNHLRRVDAITGIIQSIPAPPGGWKTPEGFEMQRPGAMTIDDEGRLYIVERTDLIVIIRKGPVVFRISGVGAVTQDTNPSDTTPPVITPTINGTAGTGGWYRSNVSLSWTITDPESSILASAGCTPSTLSTDGVRIFECFARSSGGETRQAVEIRRDTTPPSLEFGARIPAPDARGWNHTTVTIPYTARDDLSGVSGASPSSPLRFENDGFFLPTVLVRDRAGNSRFVSAGFLQIDRTPPSLSAVIDGTLGNEDWYTSDVRYHVEIDELAGSLRSISGECGPLLITEDTPEVPFFCEATSVGGTAESLIHLRRDATPPTVTFGEFSPAPNANGWNRTDVSVSFAAEDATSGLAATDAVSPLVIGAEGEGVTATVTVTDTAGNTASYETAPRNIDKTPPVIEIGAPQQLAIYGFYEDAVTRYRCEDVSPTSCTGTLPNDVPIDTSNPGVRRLTVNARDSADFTASKTHIYFVEPQFHFDGFEAPAVAPSRLNLVPRGALVPVRWRLPNRNGTFVSNHASFVSASQSSVGCGGAPAVPLADTASGPPGLTYDRETGVFTYNWQTSPSWTGCRRLTIKLKDQTTHELRFRFR